MDEKMQAGKFKAECLKVMEKVRKLGVKCNSSGTLPSSRHQNEKGSQAVSA